MITTKQNGNKLTVTIEHQCDSCEGTGLYQGMAERNGAGVVCSTCKGTGKFVSVETFTKFEGRKNKKGVERVYQTAGGYGITSKDFTDKNGKLFKFSEAGCSYKDWKNDVIPKPIEDLHCPYMHSNQNMQNSKHKAYKMYKTVCRNGLHWGLITECKNFKCKEKCWKKYYELVGDNYNEIKA